MSKICVVPDVLGRFFLEKAMDFGGNEIVARISKDIFIKFFIKKDRFRT